MVVWLVAADSELLALLSSVAEEAGVSTHPYSPTEATERLRSGDVPSGVVVTATAVDADGTAKLLDGVRRVVVATASSSGGADDGAKIGRTTTRLWLPASLDELEDALRWAAWDGSSIDQAGVSSDSSRRA